MSTRHRHPPRPSEPAQQSSAPAGGDWVAIGEVVGVFGLRGELKVAPLTDFPDRFATTPVVYVGFDRIPYRVTGAAPHKQQIVLRLEGVADATAAERLRGARVWIPEAELHPLEPDRYYAHDLIGLEVRHVDGHLLGTVKDVVTGAGNDLLVIGDPAHAADTLLPLVKAFVKRVDLAHRVMTVDPIAGLFDDQHDEAR